MEKGCVTRGTFMNSVDPSTNVEHSSEPRQFLTVKEVSARYGIPEGTIRAHAKAGLIPHVRHGRLIRFSVAKLEDWERGGGRGFTRGWRRSPREIAEHRARREKSRKGGRQ